MQAQRKSGSRAAGRATQAALVLPVLASVLGYAALALLVLTSNASARVRASAITVKFVETQGVVPSGSVASFSARCGGSAPHAVGFEFAPLNASDVGQVAVAGSAPSGRSGWRLVVKNLGSQARGYFAGVVCVGAPGARFAFVSTTGVAQAQQEDFELTRCPRSAPNPVGSTFGLQPGSAAGAAVLAEMWPVIRRGRLNGEQYGGMRNLTDTPVGISIGASCTSLPVNENVGSGSVMPANTDVMSGPCRRRGERFVGGEFFATDSANGSAIALAGLFHDTARRGSVEVVNLTTHPVPYLAGVVCVG